MAGDRSTRICVIGAGAAGLSAAWFLQKAGYTDITVLERAAEVGGKCNTFSFEGASFDMGALEVTADYFDILAMANEVGAKLTTEPPRKLIHPWATVLQAILANPVELPIAIERYKKALEKYDAFVATPGFTSMPPELCEPFSIWIEKNGMRAIGPLFEVPIFCYGYGHISEVAAAYVLKYIDKEIFSLMVGDLLPKILRGTAQWPLHFVDGFGGFWRSVASELVTRGAKIRTNVEVKTIVRGAQSDASADAPIGVTVGDAGEKLAFDRLIVASPLDVPSLGFLDLDSSEKSVFDRIVYQRYFTAACVVTDLPDSFSSEPEDVRPGNMLMFIKPWTDVDMGVFYASGDATIGWTDIEGNLGDAIAKQLPGARLVSIAAWRDWAYFPHFSQGDLEGGVYDRIEALQGRRGTYFTGGLMNFETVKTTAAYSKKLVETYF